ncbi:MAG: methyltransferase regulatory domain-containing protein [Pyrinomonadaceae bacterium]
MSEQSIFAYDRVLYPNYLHPQTHPDRLATMTKFFGVNPKSVENCRVLELGCGTGSSLLSFAYDLPDSEFIGVDLSEKQIELGNVAIQAVGLKNLQLLQGDIMQITREKFGEFDYIIAHGLYSWIPDFARDQILNICRETLATRGVAFVSYNALPGCRVRQTTRDMMLFHSKNIESPTEKVKQSMALLKFVADSAAKDKIYHSVLREELEKMSERNYENIFHDDLSEFNHPVYFHEFAAHAARYDLQFVTEVEHFTTRDINYPKEVLEILEEISDGDVIALEQYLDFVNNRRFRQTLLCHKELKINHQPDLQILRSVRIASPLQPVSEKPELATEKHEKFTGQKDEKIEINHPLTKAAFYHLGKIWTRTTTFGELVEASRKLLVDESGAKVEITEKDEQILTDILFQIFCMGMLRFHTREPKYMTEVSAKPFASPIARWQAQNSESISTLLSTSLIIQDALGKEVLKLLDGTRDHAQIKNDLTEFINSPKLDRPSELKKSILSELPEQLEKNLKSFAEMGLLVS